MLLVADSGSSKTDWRLIDADKITPLESIGLNPDFVTSEKVAEIVADTFKNIEVSNLEEVFFYGSGSSSEARKDIIKIGLEKVFGNSKITIEHDLLGAARAACGTNKGIAAILGTGSNCCLYDGENIIESHRSGGFIIGDEGGGVDFGKRLLKDFIEDKLSLKIKEKFEVRYKLSVDNILQKLYKEEFPNKFLASFSTFIFQNREDSYFSELVADSFRSFFKNQVLRYKKDNNYPINAVGSIVYYYHDYFRFVAEEFSIPVGNIVEKPISALCLYHQKLLLK